MILELLVATTVWAESPLLDGEYLARAASCRECHTPDLAPEYSGGLALPTEFGTFFTPNITPDLETGIGRWTAAQFRKALRDGISPQGKYYYPTFPYRSFSKMSDEDMDKIFIYLRSQKPVHKVNRPDILSVIFSQRWLMSGWQELFFQAPGQNPIKNVKVAIGPFDPVRGKSAEWNRGAYLVEAVLHCAECHTPRNPVGAPDPDRWMAGSNILFSGRSPPNITPDKETGLTWTRAQWIEFLASGMDPNGGSPGVEMALAVRAASGLTREDRAAAVEYITTLEAVRRYPQEVPQ